MTASGELALSRTRGYSNSAEAPHPVESSGVAPESVGVLCSFKPISLAGPPARQTQAPPCRRRPGWRSHFGEPTKPFFGVAKASWNRHRLSRNPINNEVRSCRHSSPTWFYRTSCEKYLADLARHRHSWIWAENQRRRGEFDPEALLNPFRTILPPYVS